MYNWSTDTTRFKNSTDKRIWELVQLLDYGTQGVKIKKSELIKYWPQIKNQVAPDVKRLLEYTLWGKVSSLPIKKNFWDQSFETKKLKI